MTAILETARPPIDTVDESCSFFQEIFDSLPRSDQRKWGEVYVRGLLSVPGRKTIRRISDHVAGAPVDQCLQQFVNQSPWRWEPVRQALAIRATAIRPRAWVVQEAVFPKTGAKSVGVERQYVSSAGRTLNCQLGLGVFQTGDGAGCAANWRLVLPRSWDDDAPRRAHTRLPDDERHQPRWRHLFDMTDEMRAWGLRPAPIVLDARGWPVQPLLRGLAERGLPYLIRVPEQTPVLPSAPDGVAGRILTVGQLAVQATQRRQVLPYGHDHTDEVSTALQYSVTSICEACLTKRRPDIASVYPHAGTRRLLAEWSGPGRPPSAVWLTNLTAARLPELVELVRLGSQGRQDLAALRGEFGLQDFEGRSFAGWHHHVTLVSAAHVYWTLHMRQPG
jgi:SRSO17 transposase